jgi:ribosomal protein S18 acetylase RimI-like enzyme
MDREALMDDHLGPAADSVEIEAVCSTDTGVVRELAALEVAAWGRAQDEEAVEARARRIGAELQELDPDRKGIFIGRKSRAIVGVGRIQKWPDAQDEWMVYGVAVHPEHRRQGIGRALVGACVRLARARGARRISSETHAENRASIAFHKAVGFSVDGHFVASDGDRKIAFSL